MHEHNFNSISKIKISCFGKWVVLGSENAPSYFINGLTSSFKFWNVDMHKFFFWVNGPFRAVKWHALIIVDDKMK